MRLLPLPMGEMASARLCSVRRSSASYVHNARSRFERRSQVRGRWARVSIRDSDFGSLAFRPTKETGALRARVWPKRPHSIREWPRVAARIVALGRWADGRVADRAD